MKPLEIKNFQNGVAVSPYEGFSQMVNADIFTTPGAFKISQKLTPSGNSASVITNIIKWFAQDPISTHVYGVDSAGKVYRYVIATDTWSVITGHGAGNGEGLAVWKDYLFLARNGNLDVYGPLSLVPSWTANWQPLTPPQYNNYHPLFASGQRFVLYIGNAHYVDTLEQNAGTIFDPANPATYTYNSQDLELGSEYQVTTLEELGSDIAIGTSIGINNNINVADTFFWDGVSDFISGGLTIHFAENGVWQMKNLGNVLHTIAGTGRTRLFVSTTSQAQEAKRLNNITLGNVLNPFPNAIDQKDGELLFGVSSVNGPNGSSPMGVYSYRNAAYTLRNLISTGNDGTNGGIFIGSVFLYTPDLYLVSYFDEVASKYGIDVLSQFLYTGYTSYVESVLYEVGTDDDPRTFEKCQVRLGKAMRTNDKIKIQGRNDLSGTYVDLAEFLGTDYVGKSVFDIKIKNLGYLKNLQVKILLDTGSIDTISPELLSVILS